MFKLSGIGIAGRDLARSLLILAVMIAATAWFSDLFYFPDEHYQVLEFMSYKLGITPASESFVAFASIFRNASRRDCWLCFSSRDSGSPAAKR